MIRDRLEAALVAAADSSAVNTFTNIFAESARIAADASDARAGNRLSAIDGLLISVKENIPISGIPMMIGSPLVIQEPQSDNPVVQSIKDAGGIVFGHTSMTELGLDGTGENTRRPCGYVFDALRCTGGSSNGAGVSMSLGIGDAAICTDNGGSIRVPAAWNDLVGFVSTGTRILRDGLGVLAYSQGGIGSISTTVQRCADVDATLANESTPLDTLAPSGIKIGVARGIPFIGMEDRLASKFEEALGRIRATGANVVDTTIDPLINQIRNSEISIGMIEGASRFEDALTQQPSLLFPFTVQYLYPSLTDPGVQYVRSQRLRNYLIGAMKYFMSDFDAIVMPTCKISSPLKSAVTASYNAHYNANLAVLENTGYANYFNTPAISIPMPRDTGLPCGFMLCGKSNDDRHLLAVAKALENAIRN